MVCAYANSAGSQSNRSLGVSRHGIRVCIVAHVGFAVPACRGTLQRSRNPAYSHQDRLTCAEILPSLRTRKSLPQNGHTPRPCSSARTRECEPGQPRGLILL